MKLSLKWFRRTVTSAVAAIVVLVVSNTDVLADEVELTSMGLTFEFTPVDTQAMPPVPTATVTVEAKDGGLAKLYGAELDGTAVKFIEGDFTKFTSKDDFEKLLAKGTENDGSLTLTLSNGNQVTIPTEGTIKAEATRYGLSFKANSGKDGAQVSAVEGAAAQTRLPLNVDITSINGTPVASELQAYVLFYKAINSPGSRAIFKVGGTFYQVPQNAVVTGLGRGVSGTGPQVQFPQFLAPGSQPRPDDAPKSSSNEVITARVETYYFRDAHRLAQILNRGVKSYQAAAVSQLERAAQNAGENFEIAKSRRREAEFQSEQKARELRQKKEELRRLVDAFRDRVDGGTTSKSELANELAALLGQHNAKLAEQQMVRDQTLPQLDADIAKRRAKLPSANDNTDPTDEEIQLSIQAKEAERNAAKVQLTQIEQSLTDLNATIATQKQLILDLQPKTTAGDTQTPNSQTLEALVTSVKALETEVANATLKARQANEAEELAAKGQFRAEVAAAKADPDTYAAGDMDSVDPVTQVSISVIGEGVLHLRGPRLGVVKIREMIHQLDHPVGQVKIGIMTVQINGEQGHRMENTLRRMEGNLSRGRFLTYVSQELFKRSVAEVAAIVAAKSSVNQNGTDTVGGYSNDQSRAKDLLSPQVQQFAKRLAASKGMSHAGKSTDGGRDQGGVAAGAIKSEERWLWYAQDFFGKDFLEGLADVHPNSPVLDPANKLLSLSSADSLTITEALFVTALAKSDIRQQILNRFDNYLQCDLPEKDYQWIKVNNIKKGWNPLWWGEDCTSQEHIYKNAWEHYRFPATLTFLKRDYLDAETGFEWTQESTDRLNPFQREVIRLTQGLSMEFWLRTRRTELIQKRELISQAAGPNSSGLTNAELFVVNSEIDRLTELHLNAQETVRGRKAALDKLIKQVVIAMEDDVYAQFYNPALERIRRAAAEWDVELGSVERTTILTNNRAFGKVAPQATYQFDLPKRDILLAEAMKAAYALHQDLGPLVGDPNFATLTKMFSQQSISGSTVDGTVKNVLPGLNSTTDQQNLLYADSTQPQKFGTELEKLIPDPAIYKFETGTGFQVRPVVQPDGQSVVFDFDYMYTTDLLEPTSPDERGLGRVKRHFVDTEVQLGNLEWREISRYEVALKAARNSRGVPLLEDIPVVGLAFRPLPQAKKSIQKNVIVGQAAIYPTVEDLLGLKSPSAAGLDVKQMPFELDLMQEAQRAHARKIDLLLEQKVQNALPGVPTAAAVRETNSRDGNPQLALPAPIQRLSYQAEVPVGSTPAIRNPAKPAGSAPVHVTAPQPATR